MVTSNQGVNQSSDTDPQLTHGARADNERFPSLAALRSAHGDLLKRHRQAEASEVLLPEIEQLILRGRATGALLDGEDDRWAAQGLLDYWNSLLYREGHEPPDATLAEYDPSLAPELADEDCPYLGLEAFGEGQAERFHGRQKLIGQLRKQFEAHHLLAVVGSSGSGKSSVVRGGLVPSLKAGGLSGSEDWNYYSYMVPGSHPLESLVQLLCPLTDEKAAVVWRGERVQQLRKHPEHVVNLLAELGEGQLAVIVVDQFEEVFTLCRDETERQAFCDALLAMMEHREPDHGVILTMRTDFEPQVAKLPRLKPAFEQGQVRVRAMDAGELRDAIEQPAGQVGLKFEEGLVEQLLEDVLGEPAALPLLQFTLLKLWDHREKNRVTWEAYRRLGGGRLALSNSADEFYQGLIPEDQAAAKRILLKMVRPTEGLEITSNRVRREVLYAGGEARDRTERVLEKLVVARLVKLTPGARPEDDQAEVAHEALIRNWPTLMDWLEDERVTQRQRLRLTAAAEAWRERGRDGSVLLRGAVLAEARSYGDLSELEGEFVRRSQRAEKRKQVLTRAGLVSVFVALSSLAGGMAWFALKARRAEQVTAAQQLASQSLWLLSKPSSKSQEAGALLAVESYRQFELLDESSIEMEQALRLAQDTKFARLSVKHGKSAQSVTFSPDGLRIATASPAETAVKIWDVETGEELAQLKHDSGIREVVFSPDNKHVATIGSFDSIAKVWDAETGKEIVQLNHDGRITAIDFSTDGNLVATASEDKTTRMWDVKTGRNTSQFNHEKLVNNVVFSHDGNFIATTSGSKIDRVGIDLSLEHGTIQIWDTITEREIMRFDHDFGFNEVAFDPDGSQIAVASFDNDFAEVWDVATGDKAIELNHNGSITALAFSPDGNSVATASSDNTAKIWNAKTGQEIFQISHKDSIDALAFSSDSDFIATASRDETAKVWNIKAGRELYQLSHDGAVSSIVFSPDNEQIATSSHDGTAKIWQMGTKTELTNFNQETGVISITFSPDSNRIATASWDTAKVWDVETRNEVFRLSSGEREEQSVYISNQSPIAISPDNNKIATANFSKSAKVWDIKKQKELMKLNHNGVINNIVFSPNGQYIATSSEDKIAALWDLKTGKEVKQFTVDGKIKIVAFSPDSTLIAITSDRSARIWSLVTGKEVTHLNHDNWITALSFSSNSEHVATSSWDKTAKIWDIETGEKLRQLNHDGLIDVVVFSPDGKHVATASRDGSSKIWDAETGDELIQLNHEDVVLTVTFSPNGDYIATASWDKTAKVWDARTGKELIRLDHDRQVNNAVFSPNGNYIVTIDGYGKPQLHHIFAEDLAQNICNLLQQNLSASSWQGNLKIPLENFHLICENLPVHPSFLSQAKRRVELGLKKTAIPLLKRVKILEEKQSREVDLEPFTPELDKNITAVLQAWEDSALGQSKVSQASAALSAGNVRTAVLLFQEAEELYQISVQNWHKLCREGSLQRKAEQVLFACDKAVHLSSSEPSILDSRGLARALTGDISGAINDFQAFVDNVPDEGELELRKFWLKELQAGRNPFTDEVLEELK